MEYRGAVDAGEVTIAAKAGVVTSVSGDLIETLNDDGTQTNYRLAKFRRSNQTTCINQRPLVADGDASRWGQPLPTARAPRMARWRWAATCWSRSCRGGHNYEDVIICRSVSCRTTS